MPAKRRATEPPPSTPPSTPPPARETPSRSSRAKATPVTAAAPPTARTATARTPLRNSNSSNSNSNSNSSSGSSSSSSSSSRSNSSNNNSNVLRSPRAPTKEASVTIHKQNAISVLNLLLMKGYISFEELSNLVTNQTCSDVIEDINKNVRFLQLEVRRLVYEVDGTEYWALVNNQPDETSKLASTLDELQLTFVKALLQLIITTTGMVAMNKIPRCLRTLTPEVAKKITVTVREKALAVLEKDGWLYKREEVYYMGVRAYADLRTLISSAQTNCVFCHSTCMLGRKHSKSCTAKIHHHCAKKWFEKAHHQKCAKCHETWDNEEDEEEEEQEQSQEDVQQSQEDE